MLRRPDTADWAQFYALTEVEGWRVPQNERQLFQGAWSGQALALGIDGVFGGLVTAVAYQNNGWIGNLIVPPALRGRGYGQRLFNAGLTMLESVGLSSFWLTASEQGRPIYERAGFGLVGRVERWVLTGGSRPVQATVAEPGDKAGLLRELDRKAWGEGRSELLGQLVPRGRVFTCDEAGALLQRGYDLQILGPWYSPNHCPRAGRQVLQQLLANADPATEIVADLLASSPERPLLAAAGFEPAGSVALMAKGAIASVDLGMMVCLASLGSVG